MIKMIAVDMDGTFLDDRKQYDKKLFSSLFMRLKERNMKFVVASGNQYLHLKQYFPTILDEISFVCENGALVIDKNKKIFEVTIEQELLNSIIFALLEKQSIVIERMLLSGSENSYILCTTQPEFIESGRIFYHNLQLVDSLYKVTDKIYKLTLNFSQETKSQGVSFLKELFGGRANIMTSGLKAIDIVGLSAGKEKGLSKLQERYGISNNELACFGDNFNDLGMLKKAGYSFVVGNGEEELKKMGYKVIGNNNENSVLKELKRIIEEES